MAKKRSDTVEIVFKQGSIMACIYFRDTDVEIEGKPRQVHYVHLRKRERDHNGEWADVKELYESDLPKAALVLSKAFDFLTSAGFHNEDR